MAIAAEPSIVPDDRDEAVHRVRLHGRRAGQDEGTIRGTLPLWFVHEGITYIRDASTSHQGDEPRVQDYRPVHVN